MATPSEPEKIPKLKKKNGSKEALIDFNYEDHEDHDDHVPTIEEDDLADVDDDIDLKSQSSMSLAANVELQTIGVPDDVAFSPQESEHSSSDHPETASLKLNTYDEPTKQDDDFEIKERSTGMKRRICLVTAAICTVAVSSIMCVLIPKKKNVTTKSLQQKLDMEGTLWAFDESDQFVPVTSKVSENTEESTTNIAGLLDEEHELAFPFPPHLGSGLMDFQEIPYDSNNEVPFFWQIPNSGSTMQSIMTACSHLVLASNAGDEYNSQPDTLEKVFVNNHEYVNVNLGISGGIEHAADKGLVASGLADVLVSPHLHYAVKMLFDENYKGRAFTILRHPIERTLSTFHQLKLHSKNNEYANMTLSEYLNSGHFESNWLTRFLVNRRQVGIGYEQVALAKEILRRKFLIGLYDNFEESINRIENYFGWTITDPAGRVGAWELCHKDKLQIKDDRDKADYVLLKTEISYGDENYEILRAKNQYDLEVYWYAVALFKEQGLFLQSINVSESSD